MQVDGRAAQGLKAAGFALGFLVASLACPGLVSAREGDAAIAAAAELDRVKQSPVELRMFLQRFPKGGDLHNHLSGAIYAEDFIDWAADEGLCITEATMTASKPPCDADAGRPDLAAALASGLVDRNAIIDAWSMRNFEAGISAASGHNQFFRTFFRFTVAERARQGDMLAEAVAHAAEQNIQYLELMVSPQMAEARSLAASLGAQEGFPEQHDALLAAGIADLVTQASAELAAMLETVRQRFDCPASNHPACGVEVRFLAQVIRTFPPHQVFAQSLLAFLLVEADPHVVGLNLVAPEDDEITLSTYEIQMRQLGWLAEHRGAVPVTLHAGELTLGLVHPRHLRNHIRQAIELAGARRIGHGVDIAYETDAEHLLLQMAREKIAVETSLSSNAEILGVEGAEHPFETYRLYGVPTLLSTDDEGVSRIDLTNEYRRAVETYDLGYADLKTLSRNALTYSFLAGESLWTDAAAALPVAACADTPPGHAAPPQPCADFLAGSDKARLQWRLEAAFDAFEAERATLRRERGF